MRSGGDVCRRCSNHGSGGLTILWATQLRALSAADCFCLWPGGLQPGGGTSRMSLGTSLVLSLKRCHPEEDGDSSTYMAVEARDDHIHRLSVPGLWMLKVGLLPAAPSLVGGTGAASTLWGVCLRGAAGGAGASPGGGKAGGVCAGVPGSSCC